MTPTLVMALIWVGGVLVGNHIEDEEIRDAKIDRIESELKLDKCSGKLDLETRTRSCD